MNVGIEDGQILRPDRRGEKADETREDECGAETIHTHGYHGKPGPSTGAAGPLRLSLRPTYCPGDAFP